MSLSSHYVYILLCENGAYYSGYTTDLQRRYQEHVAGLAKCKYTRSFKPIALLKAWQFKGDKKAALSCERFIKRLAKPLKKQLILAPAQLAVLLKKNSIISHEDEVQVIDLNLRSC
jgi:putative endonuclease